MKELLEHPLTVLDGRYTLERELGRGGTATVYLARDERHGRAVAVKVLRPEIAALLGPERFLREIRIAAGLTHPHILPLHDSGETAGRLWYAMPYVAGESLRDRLRREGALPVADAVAIAGQVAAALAHAHAQGIVHRDIKPENILLEAGEAVVADFGIARALRVAEAGPATGLSEPGLALGTPAYMSPEQSAGGDVDGRSDVYALGCVLYEMLVGEPPFTGPTAAVVLARHRNEAPRPVEAVRPGVALPVRVAVATALAKLPADRFATATRFAEALQLEVRTSGGVAPGGAAPAPRPARFPALLRRRIALLAAGLVLAGAAIVGIRAAHPPEVPPLDDTLYAVLPFELRGDAAAGPLLGDRCGSLMERALARWSGVRMVDPLWVADARARRGKRLDLAVRLAIARERGAGRLLTGEVYADRGTMHVRAAVYDVGRGGATLRQAQADVAPDLHDADARFADLARALLTADGTAAVSLGATAGAGDSIGTRSLAAWRAYDDGTRAFAAWDLPRAQRHFRDAIAADSAYQEPRFWLAQAQALAGAEPAEWRADAGAAAAHPSRLEPMDAVRAAALSALGDGRYAAACVRYAALVRADSLDFLAWYGLGECHRLDPVVLRDAHSPSGWRFRSSTQQAVQAYRRALELIPSAHALFRGPAVSRLGTLLLTEPGRYRAGYAVAGDTLYFGAFPGLDGDTLALVPYPIARLFAGVPGTVPATMPSALRYARETLLGVTTGWIRAFPHSADAQEAHGLALEALGRLTDGGPDSTALDAVQRARALARDRDQQLRLAIVQLRLLLKLERFDGARRLADSLLAAHPEPTAAEAEQLAGVAALTGRARRAADLLRRTAGTFTAVAPDGRLLAPPPQVGAAVLALTAYAALGAPADSFDATDARAEALITAYIEPDRRAALRHALLARPRSLAFPALWRPPSPPQRDANYLEQLQWAAAHGAAAQVRRRLAALDRSRQVRPGDVAIDATLAEARVALAAGDSAGALVRLAAALEAPPIFGTDLLADVPQAAALAGAYALAAELTARRGDATPRTRRWAGAVATLWTQADPELRLRAERLATLLDTTGRSR